ncbi:MAG: cupredoxin domain-containing protein [bacterium]
MRFKKVLLTFMVLVSVSVIGFCESNEKDMHKNHKHMMGEQTHHMGNKEMHHTQAGICPVMGNQESEKYSYLYNGTTYYFCCPMCIDMFKKDPDKYISKIKEFDIEAFQFGFSPEEITVKKGDIVRFTVSTRDVTHGFYIKEYDINVPIKKGEPQKIEFISDKTGEFDIVCSIYCGRGHKNMKAKLIVEK